MPGGGAAGAGAGGGAICALAAEEREATRPRTTNDVVRMVEGSKRKASRILDVLRTRRNQAFAPTGISEGAVFRRRKSEIRGFP